MSTRCGCLSFRVAAKQPVRQAAVGQREYQNLEDTFAAAGSGEQQKGRAEKQQHAYDLDYFRGPWFTKAMHRGKGRAQHYQRDQNFRSGFERLRAIGQLVVINETHVDVVSQGEHQMFDNQCRTFPLDQAGGFVTQGQAL